MSDRTRPMASPTTLRIEGLRAAVGGTEILRGIDLAVSSGEVHAVMGPNGAGKSTLSAVIMGKPGYEVLDGSVTLDGEDLLALAPWERAAAGLHLVMQYPTEVPGVALDDVMREALTVRGREVEDVDAVLAAEAARIGLEERLLHRALNVDLSGGEKKRNETLQLAVLQPAIAVLDELDSGLDVDALRACARRIEAETQPHDGRPGLGVLAITHYNRLLTELRPDAVHILIKGRIVERGGPELADQLEAEGYAAFADDDAAAAAAHHERPGVRPGSLDELFSTP
jgi:Fe-S cluster assembly ATP-binding protein